MHQRMAIKRNSASRLSQILKSRSSSLKTPSTSTRENHDFSFPISTSAGFTELIRDLQTTFAQHSPTPKIEPRNISLPSQLFRQEALLLTIGERYTFAHWNIDPELIQQTLEKLGGKAKLVLHFFDQQKSWDVEIFDPEGNWYLKLNQPNQALRFSVGLKNQQQFYPLCEAKPLELEDGGKKISTFSEITKALKERNETNLTSFAFRYEGVLKKSLGPYFFDLLKSGRIQSIAQTSYDALFQDMSLLHKKRSSRLLRT